MCESLVCKNSSDSVEREQGHSLQSGSQVAEGWKTVAGIQKAEASRLNNKMMKTVPRSPACKGFLFLFFMMWLFPFVLGRTYIVSNCAKYTGDARGNTGMSPSPMADWSHTHTPRLQWGKPGALFSTSSQWSFLAAHGHLWGAFVNTLRPGFQPILSTEVWF